MSVYSAPVGPTGGAGATGPTGPTGPQGSAGADGISAGKVFYLTNDASDIGGYNQLLDSPSAGAEATFTTGTLSGTTDTLIATFATNAGSPGVTDIPAGTAYRRLWTVFGNNSMIATFKVEVYKRTAGGTETLLRTDTSPQVSGNTAHLVEWTYTAADEFALNATDRLVVKLYVTRVSGTGTTVTVYAEGATHASHVQTTISTGAVGATGPTGSEGWTTVRKTADESVASSAVLQNDDELFFTADAGVLYEIEIILKYGSPAGGATPDLHFALGEDGTVRGQYVVSYLSSSAETPTTTTRALNQTDVTNAGTATADRGLWIKAVHAGNGGTFRLLWSQETSGANPTIVRAGSRIKYRAIT